MSLATMMSVPLTLSQIATRAEQWNGSIEVVSRRPDKSIHRSNYREVIGRSYQLAKALVHAGLQKGERVATLMWNNSAHLEAYFGIPLAGGVVHTLNLRLHPDEIAWIASDAKDKFLIVDEVLLPLFEKFKASAPFQRVFVVASLNSDATGLADKKRGLAWHSPSSDAYQPNLPHRSPDSSVTPLEDYEKFLSSAPAETRLPTLSEEDALGTCYTSGTTGKPKGVVYSHRSTILHSLVTALPDSLSLSRADTLLPVVPMFHVNAWGLPYAAAMVGAKLIFPGPHLDPTSLLDLMESEKVTISAGVPTIWLGIRECLDTKPRSLQPGLRMVVGGSAAPEQLIKDFDRQGMTLLHAWGMTETSPVGLVSRVPPELRKESEAFQYKLRAKQGVPPPLVEISVRNEQGEVPRDGKTSGELLIRGPWIAASYSSATAPEKWTQDGFFRTGDVANIDQYGFVQLTDRIADLIKSGGEWIASQEIENFLMGHPAVREAAVIGVPHQKWSERPLAAVVFKPGASATPEELKEFLAPHFAKFWLPDAFVVLETIPRTSAGKFKKTELREKFKDWRW